MLPQNTPSAAPTGLDPSVVNLAKSIRQVESGGNFGAQGKSGEYGAYQFTLPTWNAASAKYGINVPLQQATPQQQNEVAYKQIKDWKDSGHNVGEIASMWNAGAGRPNAYLENHTGVNSMGVSYDTPAYAQRVAQTYQQIKSGQDPQQSTVPPAPTDASQPPSIGGFAGNVVKSGANLVGNIGNALLHPIQTVQNIGGAAVGGVQELGGQQNDNTAKFDNLINFVKDRYGSVDQLKHTLYTDPVGVAADLSTLLSGGAAAVGKVGTLAGAADASRAGSIAAETGLRTMAQDTAVGNTATRAAGTLSTAADLTNPITPVLKAGSKLFGGGTASTVAETLASKVTGMEPSTIQQIIKTPEAFTAETIANSSRKAIADEVVSALDKKQADLAETGSAYKPIREAPTPIGVNPNYLEQQLKTHAGVEVQDGKIVTNASAKVRDARDVRGLQNLYDTYKPVFARGAMTPPEFLNFRTDLAKLAKYERDIGKSADLERIAADMRSSFNEKYRSKLPGLENLDHQYSGELQTLQELRSGLIKNNGELVANGINKIARAIGTGKEPLLEQLEKIIPGITHRLKVQNAIEDIQRASGNKVGTYTKSTLEAGGVIIGAMTGNVHILAGALATAIFASPEIAVPILKALHFKEGITKGVLANLAKMVNAPTVLNRATQGSSDQQTAGTADTVQQSATSQDATPAP